jgi:hypothetical protein
MVHNAVSEVIRGRSEFYARNFNIGPSPASASSMAEISRMIFRIPRPALLLVVMQPLSQQSLAGEPKIDEPLIRATNRSYPERC